MSNKDPYYKRLESLFSSADAVTPEPVNGKAVQTEAEIAALHSRIAELEAALAEARAKARLTTASTVADDAAAETAPLAASSPAHADAPAQTPALRQPIKPGMQVEQARWTKAAGWEPEPPGRLGAEAQLVFLFGGPAVLREPKHLAEVERAYPNAHRLGCSTAGEIFGTHVSDDSLVVTAVRFMQTRLRGASTKIADMAESFQAGARLAQSLDQEGLRHVFVLSDGLNVNGSELVSGLTQHLPPAITVTGGLAGDYDRFQETFVVWDGAPEPHTIAALGLYGDRLKVGYGSLGGWDSFGPERLITRSKGNILYELDGKSALALYRQYLGEYAQGLPATGLLFPLSLRTSENNPGLVRTILGINEAEQSMTFAGDVPQGTYARLMKANFNRLLDGAAGAAKTSYEAMGSTSPDLAILISCVGRKLVLRQRIEEEVEGVRDVLGERTVLAGYYSYGEISPFTPNAKCELHNQTMTITTFSEQ